MRSQVWATGTVRRRCRRRRPAVVDVLALDGHGPLASNGLNTAAPRLRTSEALRVANVRACILAVAASRPSTTATGRMVLIATQMWATRASAGRVRSPNDRSTSRNQRSRATARWPSRGRASSIPLLISPVTSTLRNRSESSKPAYQAATAASQRPPLHSSETTFVSISNIRDRFHRPDRAAVRSRSARADGGKQALEIGRRGFFKALTDHGTCRGAAFRVVGRWRAAGRDGTPGALPDLAPPPTAWCTAATISRNEPRPIFGPQPDGVPHAKSMAPFGRGRQPGLLGGRFGDRDPVVACQSLGSHIAEAQISLGVGVDALRRIAEPAAAACAHHQVIARL